MSHRRVLILAYYFPPSVDAGSKRALGFFRNLRDHGWEPTVLTVADGNYATVDGDPWNDPGDGSVVRVPETRYPWQRRAPAGRADTAGAGGRPGPLRRAVREALYVPDAWRGFHAPALRRARELHRERAFDVVWTTSSPWTLLRTGAALRRDGLPWVADLRDLWSDNQLGSSHGAWRRRLDQRLERRWLGAADAVTVVTAGQRDILAARGLARRVDVVSNGFLERADDTVTQHAADDDFRVVHTGKAFAHPGYSIEPFLDALALLRREHPGAFARVRASFYGRVPAEFATLVAARDLGLSVAYQGLIARAAAEAAQRSAGALLAVSPADHPEIAVTKVFDYVGALAPVLVIGCPTGETAAVVRESGAGDAFPPGDVAGIAAWLRERIESPPEPAASRVARLPRVMRWSYAALAGELASVLDSVVSGDLGTIR